MGCAFLKLQCVPGVTTGLQWMPQKVSRDREEGVVLACSPDDSRGLAESCLALPASHVLTVTPCRCLRSWTRSAGRWQKKPKMEAFQSMTEKETSANALTMQTNWVGGGKERAAVGVWHRTGSANSAFCVLQARQALAAPSTLLWAWPSSPWCSWCWQPAWPWQWELQPGTSCDRHSVALLGGKGRDVPCLFSDLSLAGGELAAEWE